MNTRFLRSSISALGFLVLYVPLFSLILYSFYAPISGPGSEMGWSFFWYRKLFSNDTLLAPLLMSLWVGGLSTLGATILGTLAAFAIERYDFPGRRILDGVTQAPLVLPEIVMGLGFLIWFVALKLTLGAFSVILAHITFSLSYVVVTVRARLEGFDETLEDAARDLGANPWRTFTRVTLPIVWPGILSGALMAFTISFDDFLITFFTAGVGSDTLPVKIYSMIKFGISPEISALSTLVFVATFLLISIFFGPFRSLLSSPQRKPHDSH